MIRAHITDLLTGATDGYFGNWHDGEAVPPVVPDLSVIGGKPPKEEGEK